MLIFNFDFIVLVIKLFTIAPPDLFRETLLLEFAIAHFHHHSAVFDAEHEFARLFGHVFFEPGLLPTVEQGEIFLESCHRIGSNPVLGSRILVVVKQNVVLVEKSPESYLVRYI